MNRSDQLAEAIDSFTDAEPPIRIGDEIRNIRILIDMSQQKFAEAIRVNRVTYSRLENAADDEISMDLAFRLYYALEKIFENEYINSLVRSRSRNLQKRLEREIILKQTAPVFSPIAYVTK